MRLKKLEININPATIPIAIPSSFNDINANARTENHIGISDKYISLERCISGTWNFDPSKDESLILNNFFPNSNNKSRDDFRL